MSVRHCEFQIIAPEEFAPEPAPTHPDPATRERMASACRDRRPRRFAFCEVARTAACGPTARPVYHGLRNSDGACVLLLDGKPYGWYRSVDSAFAHLHRDDLWLLWLDQAPAAAAASGRGELPEFGGAQWDAAVRNMAASHAPQRFAVVGHDVKTRDSAILAWGFDYGAGDVVVESVRFGRRWRLRAAADVFKYFPQAPAGGLDIVWVDGG